MYKKIIFFFVAVSLSLAACIKSDEPVTTGVINTAYTYSLSSYTSNGTEFAQLFDGYTFTFGNSNGFLAVKNGINAQANWRPTQDSVIVSGFPAAPLNLLNKDWNKGIINDYSVELVRVEGSNTYKAVFNRK
jgi:hypothetical protein